MNVIFSKKATTLPKTFRISTVIFNVAGLWIAWLNQIMTWKKQEIKNITSNAKRDFFRHSQGKSTEYAID
jgi:hypothetical protein